MVEVWRIIHCYSFSEVRSDPDDAKTAFAELADSFEAEKLPVFTSIPADCRSSAITQIRALSLILLLLLSSSFQEESAVVMVVVFDNVGPSFQVCAFDVDLVIHGDGSGMTSRTTTSEALGFSLNINALED